MKKLASVFTLLLLVVTIGSTALATNSVGNAASASNTDLENYIENEFEKTHVPAMSVQIVDKEGVEFTGNYGNCQNADTPFILGSISKSFTAVAITQLVEQGKIDVERPMATYLPDVDQNCKTTVQQLLHHTSGIHTYMKLENYKSSDTDTQYEYSNVNYNLLGQIVENVSGMSYADYLKENIFKPLGMEHSYVSLDEAKMDHLIKGSRNAFGIMYPAEYAYPTDNKTGWMACPAAYVISTANDMGKYLTSYLSHGVGMLTENGLNQMWNDTIEVQENYEYGYGWGIDRTSGATLMIHGGNVENYTTYMVLLPDQEKAIIVLTNACDYFVANEMVIQTTYNIAYKLIGMETNDIAEDAYVKTHAIIDSIYLLIALICLFPIIFIRIWCRKYNGKLGVLRVVGITLLHIALPTLLLSVPKLLGGPMWVAARFAPDTYWLLLLGSILLYFTGIMKIIYIVFARYHKA